MRHIASILLFFIINFAGGVMNTGKLHWLGHSAFRIEDNGLQIYIDPFRLSSDKIKADIIFITHGHFDHFSNDDITRIRKETTIFVAPADAAAKLGKGTVAVVPGKSYSVSGLKFRTVPAYNIGKRFHPKENNWVGYIITLSDGMTVYHAGDTDAIPEMKNISTDVALLPCDGKYTMNVRQAAEIANEFHPKVLIPMHWADSAQAVSGARELKELFKGEVEIKKEER
jgi:L-ascorbate metabolism protein UlaG (beta-lactamase superfamily)